MIVLKTVEAKNVLTNEVRVKTYISWDEVKEDLKAYARETERTDYRANDIEFWDLKLLGEILTIG